MRLTWLGHSTVLVDLDGIHVITDPLLRRRVAHLWRAAPIDSRGLEVDAALVSHVHWDHLDLRSLDQLGRGVLVVVPRGAAGLLRRRGFANVAELEPAGTFDLGAVQVRATHAEHDVHGWPRRATAPALGYVLEGSRTIYFAGDTDLFAGMEGLADPLDVALLPVAGWGRSLPPGHLNPDRAAEALRLLRPKIAVPIHWGTYAPIFRPARGGSPAEEFRRRAGDVAADVDVRVLPVGGSLEL